jgi:hypothetical protein
MKTAKTFAVAALVGLALAAIAAPADATGYRGYYRGHSHGHSHYYPRTHFSIGVWGPGYWGWPGYWGPYRGYYGPSYYGGYYGGPTVVYTEPRVYVERDPAPAPAEGQWWYWCQSAKGYYPYVNACPEGWQRVAPQPPQAPR